MTIQFPEGRDVKLRNFQTRMEKHGEDDRPALDLAIEWSGPNTELDALDPALRPALFKPLVAQEGELPLTVDDLPSVRLPLLKTPLKWDREWIGYTLKVAYGATGKADMVLGGVKVSKAEIHELIEGGTVTMRASLSTTDVSEKVIGKLALLQGHSINITLTPPDIEDEPKSDAGQDPAWPFPNDPAGSVTNSAEGKPLTAEDVFIGNEAPAE